MLSNALCVGGTGKLTVDALASRSMNVLLLAASSLIATLPRRLMKSATAAISSLEMYINCVSTASGCYHNCHTLLKGP